MDKRSLTSAENGKKGGRPPLSGLPAAESIMEMLRKHALEEVEVIVGKSSIRCARALVLFNHLYEIGLKSNNVDAVTKYFDRILGLAKASTDITSNGQTIKLDL